MPTSAVLRHQEQQTLLQRFQTVFETAARKRRQRRGTVNGEFEWVVYERHQMFNAVNRERTQRGKTKLGIEAVQKVERQALGHADYGHKFALYCAWLVLDTE